MICFIVGQIKRNIIVAIFVFACAANVAAQVSIPFPGPGWAPQAATISNTDFEMQNSGATTYTYTGKAIGTASAYRHIIVAIAANTNVASRTISSVTVGGISATAAVSAESTNTVFTRVAVYIAAVPTGTTADIVVTYSAAQLRSAIGVYAAYNLLSTTPTSTGTSSSDVDPMTASLTVNAGGVAVGVAMNYYSTAQTDYAWTNMTKDNDIVNNTFVGTTTAHTSGSFSGTITANPNGSGTIYSKMVVAAFR